jgi:ATP-dependent Zn protease
MRVGGQAVIMPDRKRTAYHEAGHGIVARALGRAVERITIDPNSQCGSTKLTELPHDPTVPDVPPPNVLANRLAHYLSGDRAERMQFGDCDENRETALALRFATNNPNIGREHVEQFVATIAERIDAILQSNAVQWRALAARLLVEDQIEGEDLDASLRDVIDGDVYP